MTFLGSLVTQVRVIAALLVRETRTRFGHSRVGYLWAVSESLVTIGLFWGINRIAGRSAIHGMDLFPYLAMGVIPFFCFAHAYGKVSMAIIQNRPLLFYPQVMPVDVMLARGLLEIATSLLVFALVLGGYGLVTYDVSVEDSLLTISSLLMAGLLGTAWGIVLSGLYVAIPSAQRMINIVMRPLFWVSGLFFTANDLPSAARSFMLWNPVLHCTELARDGWFTEYTAHYADPTYVWLWILGCAAVGLSLERVVRRKVQVT